MNSSKHWKGKDGDLSFDPKWEQWTFSCASRRITITPWADTSKGPMTELYLSSSNHRIIMEFLDRRFSKELCSPDQPDKTATKVMELIKVLAGIDMEDCCSPYWLINSLTSCIDEVAKHFDGARFVHVYYGTGLAYGIKITRFGKPKKLDAIPGRCLEFPGTRLDSWV